jgi:chromatin segregation and condensation protein Rec8/ScpA/Scc1 (kleisin family)
LERRFDKVPEVNLNQELAGKKKFAVVSSLFEVLVLKTFGYVDLHQKEPYADILVSKESKFDAYPKA